MKIPYTTHRGGNTIYAGIDKKHLSVILRTLQHGLNALNERSNYDTVSRDILQAQMPEYGKHTAAGVGKHNSLASFAAGLLNQHLDNPKKDISIKMLAGITLASQVFREVLGTDYLELVFDPVGKPGPTNPLFEISDFLT